MHGHALRESEASALMSSCSALATPVHDVNLGAGGPPAGGGGGVPARGGGGVSSRVRSKRARLAPVRGGSSHVIAWSCGHVVAWSCSRVVAWFESCGRVVRVMWSRGHVVMWSCGRVDM